MIDPIFPDRLSLTLSTTLTLSPDSTGIAKGHTGHVRFLTSVEMGSSSTGSSSPFHAAPVAGVNNGMSRHAKGSSHPSAGSSSATGHLTSSTGAGMLVVSGGDGYEDFTPSLIGSGISPLSETAGRDDSTNHLLLWSV